MKPVDEHPEIRKTLLTLRIIVIALCMGLSMFLAVTWFKLLPERELASSSQPSPGDASPDVLVHMVFWGLGIMLPVWVIVRAVMRRKARDAFVHGGAEAFRQAFSRAVITLAAMFEGVGFFGAVVWLATADPRAVAVAGVCLVGMLSQIPSEGTVNTLLEDVP